METAKQKGEPGDEASPASRSAHQANILSRATRGAFWIILSGTGARFLGIVGTLAITHYLSPEEYGEVSLAALVTMTASVLANCGLSQYVASKPNAGRAAVFHASFYFLLTGAFALGLSAIFGGPFGRLVSAPNIARLLPALALSAFLDRLWTIQDRIQLRDLRFRSASVQRAIGEIVYSVVSVILAATCAGTMFGGAWAIVWATMARSVVRLTTITATTPWREWIEPHRITRAQTRELFTFGWPMSIATIAGFGSSKFDNFVFAHHFGEGSVGLYNLAYNFADMPASLVAETVGDVLVPSFAHMEDDKNRKDALLLSLRVLVLIVTPLAVGLALVAPNLVKLAFPPRYVGITQALRILAMLGVPRTVLWTCNSYLQVRDRTRAIMKLELYRMVGIVLFMHVASLAAIAIVPRQAMLVACGSVVLVFFLSAITYMVAIRKLNGVSLVDQIRPLLSAHPGLRAHGPGRLRLAPAPGHGPPLDARRRDGDQARPHPRLRSPPRARDPRRRRRLRPLRARPRAPHVARAPRHDPRSPPGRGGRARSRRAGRGAVSPTGLRGGLLPLPEDEVHLWYLLPEATEDPALSAAYEALLSPEERARRDRYRFEHSRREYLLTRALARATLSRYAPVAPAAWTVPAEPVRPPRDRPPGARRHPLQPLEHPRPHRLRRGPRQGDRGRRRGHGATRARRWASPIASSPRARWPRSTRSPRPRSAAASSTTGRSRRRTSRPAAWGSPSRSTSSPSSSTRPRPSASRSTHASATTPRPGSSSASRSRRGTAPRWPSGGGWGRICASW